MSANPDNSNFEFKNADQAFEYLVQQRLDEKRKARWAEELKLGPDELETPQKKRNNIRLLIIRMSSAAAVVLVVAGYFLFLQNPDPLNEYSEGLMKNTEFTIQYGSSNRGESTAGGAQDVKRLKMELTSALLDGDFSQALGYFKQLEKTTPLTFEDKYYYSISILKTSGEDKQKAIRMLGDIIEENEVNNQKALLLRGLAYGMTNNAVLMQKDLERINSSVEIGKDEIDYLLSKY